MIPLKDDNPTRSFPIVTILLIAANVAVFWWQNMAGPAVAELLTGTYGFIPYELTHNADLVGALVVDRFGHAHYVSDPSSLSRFPNADIVPLGVSPHPIILTAFTAMFMHGSLMHIAGNMLFLWIFGNNVEDALGKARYFLFYLGCGLAATLLQTIMGPNSLIPNLGASGAIAGIMGAYLLLWPDARVSVVFFIWIIPFFRDISAFWVLGMWIGYQFLMAHFLQGGEATGGVAYFAHIGGFVAGLVGVILLGGRKLIRRPKRRYTYDG
jgi:membrane associated rhomboid family serine protease